jgi:hypothetical protein
MVGRLWELCAGKNCSAQESAAYRSFWDSNMASLERRHLPSPERQRRENQRTCVYLGQDTGDRQLCFTCRGRVELKVFQCRHPAHSTQPTTTHQECRRCLEFSATSDTEEDRT